MTLQKLTQDIKNSNKNRVLDDTKQDNPFHPSKPIPPLATWSPTHSEKMDLTIRADGSWWHEGARMTRQSLIDLFATVLWSEMRDEHGEQTQQFYLKTPVEKVQITVEDVPLLIVDVQQVAHEGKTYLEFATQTGDYVVASDDCPIIMRAHLGQMRPYIKVRTSGTAIEALIHRNTFYHLVNMGDLTEVDGQAVLKLTSGDAHFQLTGLDWYFS